MDWSKSGVFLALAALLGLGLAGCQAELERGLDEGQANAIVVALDQAGIGATKEAEAGGGDEPSFLVSVAPDDVAPALAILRAEGLPREDEPGLAETFGEGSLVPTATEERARMTAALSGELARSIESIDGVLDARVHVALPQAQSLGLDAPHPRPRASVMVRYRAPATAGEAPPYDEAAIRRLVAGAIEDMTAEDVAIVGVSAARAPGGERQLSQVGPFSVSRSSATNVKLALGALLGTNLVLAIGLALSFLRAGRLRKQAEDDAKDAKAEQKK